ncbi:MAG: TonB family protein [Pontiella sp.]
MRTLLSQLKYTGSDPECIASVISAGFSLLWIGIGILMLSHASADESAVSVAPVVSKRVLLNLERVVITESTIDLMKQEKKEIQKEVPESEPIPRPDPEPQDVVVEQDTPAEPQEVVVEQDTPAEPQDVVVEQDTPAEPAPVPPEPQPKNVSEPQEQPLEEQEQTLGSIASGSRAVAKAEAAVIDAAENSKNIKIIYAELRGLIEKRKSYPTIARRLRAQGVVTVLVKLNDGRVVDYEMVESTGHRSLRQGLEKTMKRVKREFESSYKESIPPVRIAVEYVLN